MPKRIRKIDIVESKLGRNGALGTWEEPTPNNTVITIDERLKGFQRLLIVTHEALHEACKDWTEEKVVEVSELLASIIWRCDYRHVDHKGEDKPDYTHVPRRSKIVNRIVKTYEKKSR